MGPGGQGLENSPVLCRLRWRESQGCCCRHWHRSRSRSPLGAGIAGCAFGVLRPKFGVSLQWSPSMAPPRELRGGDCPPNPGNPGGWPWWSAGSTRQVPFDMNWIKQPKCIGRLTHKNHHHPFHVVSWRIEFTCTGHVLMMRKKKWPPHLAPTLPRFNEHKSPWEWRCLTKKIVLSPS